MVDINKEECKSDCSKGCQGSCRITISSSKKKERTEFQELMNHLGNLAWIFFMVALIFSHSTFLIVALFVAAMTFEEFD